MADFTRAQLPVCNGKFQGNFGGICTHAITAADSSFRAEKNIVFRISYAGVFLLVFFFNGLFLYFFCDIGEAV